MSAVENPPAFPATDAGCGSPWQEGMTLRDWFAGQALGFAHERAASLLDYPHRYEATAMIAYAYADALLSERAKMGEG